MLPYIHPDGSKKGADAMRDYVERSIARKPLGLLIDQFEEAAEGDKQRLVQELKAFVIARNDFVHHFYRNRSFDLTSPDGADAAIAYLDEQYEQTREWARIFRALVAALLLALMESDPKLATELAPHREKLLAQLSRSPDWAEADFVIECTGGRGIRSIRAETLRADAPEPVHDGPAGAGLQHKSRT